MYPLVGSLAANVKALSSVVVRLAQCFDLKLTKTSTKQIIN